MSALTVTLDGCSSSLTRDGRAEFRAHLLDSSNKEIEDVVFRWSVLSLGGNGSAEARYPQSWEGTLIHRYVGVDGVHRFVPGSCQMRAVATYRGVEYAGLSQAMELLP